MLNTNNTSTDLSDQIFESSTSTDTPTSTEDAANTAGWTVQVYGAVSGISVGTVTNTSVTETYTNYSPSVTIDDLVEANYTTIGGDSGGPITDGTGAYLLGVQSGHTCSGGATSCSPSYYSPINEIESNLNITPTLN
jgi:streptogrisin B